MLAPVGVAVVGDLEGGGHQIEPARRLGRADRLGLGKGLRHPHRDLAFQAHMHEVCRVQHHPGRFRPPPQNGSRDRLDRAGRGLDLRIGQPELPPKNRPLAAGAPAPDQPVLDGIGEVEIADAVVGQKRVGRARLVGFRDDVGHVGGGCVRHGGSCRPSQTLTGRLRRSPAFTSVAENFRGLCPSDGAPSGHRASTICVARSVAICSMV